MDPGDNISADKVCFTPISRSVPVISMESFLVSIKILDKMAIVAFFGATF